MKRRGNHKRKVNRERNDIRKRTDFRARITKKDENRPENGKYLQSKAFINEDWSYLEK